MTADDEFVFNGEAAHADLGVGDTATKSFTVKVEDASGTFVEACIDVTFCGVYDTIEELGATLPTRQVTFQIVDENLPTGTSDEAFSVLITGSGDACLDAIIFSEAYCLAAFEAIRADAGGTDPASAPALKGTLSILGDGSVRGSTGRSTLAEADLTDDILDDELDNMINWILNQDFGAQDNGDGTGTKYTDAEIQAAIWGITDNTVFVASGGGTTANADRVEEGM